MRHPSDHATPTATVSGAGADRCLTFPSPGGGAQSLSKRGGAGGGEWRWHCYPPGAADGKPTKSWKAPDGWSLWVREAAAGWEPAGGLRELPAAMRRHPPERYEYGLRVDGGGGAVLTAHVWTFGDGDLCIGAERPVAVSEGAGGLWGWWAQGEPTVRPLMYSREFGRWRYRRFG